MPLIESLIGPISSIIDKLIPDKAARDKAKLELLQLQGTQELAEINSRLSAIVAEANSHDPWTSRARPSFLYVMYTLLLFALPMGILAAFRPDKAMAIENARATGLSRSNAARGCAIEANGIGMEPSQVRKVEDSPASRGRVAVRPDYCAHVDSVVNCRAYFASGESGAAQ